MKDNLIQIEKDRKYLEEKKIDYIYKELLNKILLEKPENIDSLKILMINELKNLENLNESKTFFLEEDFENMFENFDLFNKGEVEIIYLYKSLEILKIPYDSKIILKKYKIEENEKLKKKTFTRIINREYNKLFKLN